MRVHPRIELTSDERSDLRRRVLAFVQQSLAVQVVTRGADGLPRFRLMGGKVENDFTYKTISIRPSSKIQELEADPYISIIFLRNDVHDSDSDQPIRHVILTGRAELVTSGADIRNLSHWKFPHHLDDDTLERTRCGILVHPTTVRTEGFFPGPRYPVYLSTQGES